MPMSEDGWDGFVQRFGPVKALEYDIFEHMYLKPSRILLPTSLLLEGEKPEPGTMFGLEIIWTEADIEPSLVYTPPKTGD